MTIRRGRMEISLFLKLNCAQPLLINRPKTKKLLYVLSFQVPRDLMA
jgi:hypothetical protein